MMFWGILAALTAVVIAMIGLPLVRPRPHEQAPEQSDAEIYKAQLDEIERERERHVLSEAEAEAARIEVSRRLLRTASPDDSTSEGADSAKQNDLALAFVTVMIPAVALAGYLALGSPVLPQQPHAERMQQSPEAERVAGLVKRVEERLRTHPDDGAGWDVIAPVYLRQQQYHDAVFAFQQALRLNGESAARLEGLGEAITLRDNGRVNEQARVAFSRALERNPSSLKARFWLAIRDERQGKLQQAADAYKRILHESPENAPWRAMVGTRLAMVRQRMDPSTARAPALSPEARRAAESMTAEERAKMIENMVAGLAARLKTDGNDLEGWLRLMRAYKVLGKAKEAKQAASSARDNFKDDENALQRIDAAARRLGLKS